MLADFSSNETRDWEIFRLSLQMTPIPRYWVVSPDSVSLSMAPYMDEVKTKVSYTPIAIVMIALRKI